MENIVELPGDTYGADGGAYHSTWRRGCIEGNRDPPPSRGSERVEDPLCRCSKAILFFDDRATRFWPENRKIPGAASRELQIEVDRPLLKRKLGHRAMLTLGGDDADVCRASVLR